MFCGMFCFTLLGVYLLRYKDLINATILISEVFTNGEAAKTLVLLILFSGSIVFWALFQGCILTFQLLMAGENSNKNKVLFSNSACPSISRFSTILLNSICKLAFFFPSTRLFNSPFPKLVSHIFDFCYISTLPLGGNILICQLLTQ